MNISVFITSLRVLNGISMATCLIAIRFGGFEISIGIMTLIVMLGIGISVCFISCASVKTSEKTETIDPVKLVRLSTKEDTEYYLVRNNGELQYSITGKTGDLETSKVAEEHSKVYYGAKKADDIYVVVHKTTKICHKQWMFLRSDDEKSISYTYDFYIPSRESILYTY